MLTVMVWHNVNSIYWTHTDRLSDTADSILQLYVRTASSYMAQVDYPQLEEYTQSVLRYRELSYIFVLDPRGRRVIQSGKNIPDNIPVVDSHPTLVTNGLYEVSSDIALVGRALGKVYMGFDLAVMQEAINEARDRSIAIAMTEIILSVIATIFIGIGLTRSLQRLASAADKVGGGHYDVTIPVNTNDEVGQTSRAFNDMVRAIADRSRRLEKSQSLVHMLMDSTAEGIYGVDRDGLCTFANPSCVRMLGYTDVNELIGKNLHAMIHHTRADGRPYPAEQCRIKIATSQAMGTHADDEVHWRKDGSSFPVEYWSHPLKDNGEIIGTVVTFIDITERKEHDAELSQYRDHLEELVEQRSAVLRQQSQIIDQIHDSVVSTDLDGNIISWNKGAERLFGYTAEEAIGNHISFVYPENQHTFLQEQVIRPLKEKGNHEIEVIMQRKSGENFYALLSLSLLRDAKGNVTAMVGYSIDISQRIKDEHQLRVAKQEAEDANRAKTEFLSRMSHELRTPLNAVLGYAQLMEIQFEDGSQEKEQANEIFIAGSHLLTLIDEIMDLSRIESKQIDTKPERFELEKLLLETISFIRPLAAQNGITIEYSQGNEIYPYADVTRVKEVMLNLLSNAVKYNKENGQVFLDCEEVDNYARITVRDTGIGFSEEQKKMLFEPFSRLGAEYSGIQGTGIGMTIVKMLTELMGGYITVESTVGEGSCFQVYLPLQQASH